ncbi:transposition [Fragilaria crotonensis]|nr:transposition [Fragilaria crotonensis]
MTEVGKSYFPILHAYQKQVVYMQHYLRLGSHTVRNFATRLRELNNYLPYFPREEGKAEPSKLSDDDLIQILNQAKPEEWQAVILGANIELYKFDFQGTVDYFEKLELRQALEAKRRKVDKSDNPEGTKKGNWNGKSADKMATAKTQSSKYKKCAHCGRANHTTKDCWFNPENKETETCLASVRSATLHPSTENSDAEIVEMFSPKTTISTVETKEDSDESSIYFGSFSSEILPSKDGHGSKRQKQKHKTTEVVGEVMGTGKPGIVRILLDTGASATIIKDAIRGLTGPVFKTSHTRWHTMGGQFVTKLQREIKFKLPEFSTSKIVQWVCHEDTHTLRKNAQYDMIIGADLLSELGIEINFNTQRIVWEGVEIPMKEKHVISDLQNATAIYYHSIEPTVLKEAEARQKRILDADYSALDLDDYAHMDTHLSNDQQKQLTFATKVSEVV